jgi:hypothetical protein
MIRLALISIMASLLIATPASAAQTPNQIMGHLAANQTHSWVDDNIGLTAMFRKYYAGERLYVTCGNVAEIGRQLLSAAGYKSRVVQVITKDPFDYVNDGHLMTEVFYEGRWQLYDADANVRAVNANGAGISLVEQVAAVKAGTARWETITTDPLWNDAEPNQQSLAIAKQVFGDPDAFYRHVMGVALLPKDVYGRINYYGTYFWDASQVTRLQAYPGGSSRTLATDAIWSTLTAPPVSSLVTLNASATTTATATSAATPQPTTSIATRPHAQRHRSCKKLKRQYRRTHTRRAHRRYLRCVRTRRQG